MYESINDPIHEQMQRMAARTEASRRQMYDEMMRQRASMDMQSARTQGIMSQAWMATQRAAQFTASAASSVYGHAAPPIGASMAYMGARMPSLGRETLAAFGMGGGAFAYGPQLRGMVGGYYSGAQSFGGLLYEGMIGDALKSTLGMGLFFQDVNKRFGVAPGIIREAASDELALRLSAVGNKAMAGIPIAATRLGWRFKAIEQDVQRDLTQRLSFIRSDGMDGGAFTGYGFRSSSSVMEGMTSAQMRAFQTLNKRLGYGVSNDEVQAAMNAAIAGFSERELENAMAADPSGKTLSRRLEKVTADMERVARDTHADIKAIQNFRAALRSFGDEAGITVAEGIVASDVQAGRLFGGGNPEARLQAQLQFMNEARALGLDDLASQARYGGRQYNRSLAVYEQSRTGLISGAAFSMYGGDSDFERAQNYRRRVAQLGVQSGMSSPGLRALFYSGAGLAGIQEGRLDYLGGLGAQANAMLRDPLASLKAEFDPNTQMLMASEGMFTQYASARAYARTVGSIYGVDEGSASFNSILYKTLQQKLGLGSPVEARRLADKYQNIERELYKIFGDRSKAEGAAGLASRLETIMPAVSGDMSAVANMYKANPNARNLSNEDLFTLALTAAGRPQMSTAYTTGELSGTTRIRLGMDPGEGRGGVSYMTANFTNRRGVSKGRLMDIDGREGLRTGDFNAWLTKIANQGGNIEDLNQIFAGNGGKWKVNRTDTGAELMVWTQKGWVRASEDSDQRDRIGTSYWNKDPLIKSWGELQEWERRHTTASGFAAGSTIDYLSLRPDAVRGFFGSGDAKGIQGKIAQLFESGGSSAVQKEFYKSFTDSGKLTAASLLRGFGSRDRVRAFLKNYYKPFQGGRDLKLADMDTDEEVNSLLSSVTALGDLRLSLVRAHIDANASIFETMARNQRGTFDQPMVVQIKDGKAEPGQ